MLSTSMRCMRVCTSTAQGTPPPGFGFRYARATRQRGAPQPTPRSHQRVP
jgi:hypothetical protein